MSDELIYNPLEDTDKNLPIYKKDGKNLIVPMFICGVKIKDVTANKSGDNLRLAELQFEVHESAEKMEIDIFPEDEDGNYNYRAQPVETVNGSVFVGTRIKGGNKATLWKNKTKGSGRTNKYLLQSLKNLGIEIKTKKVETNGKKINAEIIPELTEDLLLGKPVFGWLDQESFTSSSGNNVTYTAVNKYTKMENADDVTVMENSLKETNTGGSTSKAEDDPFGDMDDDLPF